ncbi:MAG: hypothetical protein ABF968_12885 [Acetobacter sp.]|uniref:hypothetical protein n=1 Tax=Acetobacter sp. TaxID=440 RepID=UPI0039E999A6
MTEAPNAEEKPQSGYMNIARNIFKSLGKMWGELDEEIKNKVLDAATGMFDGILRNIFKLNKEEKDQINDGK